MNALLAAAVISCYTNHAGIVVKGAPVSVRLDAVTLSNEVETVTLPFTIFPERERRRLAADAGSVQFIPMDIRRTVAASRKAEERSRKRAEKGLCTPKASEDFRKESAAARAAYLREAVRNGRLLPSERKLLD